MRITKLFGFFLLCLPSLAIAEVQDDNSAIRVSPSPAWVKASKPLDVPEDAQGLAFYRKQDSIVRLTSDGARSYSSQLIRILQPQALQLGNLSISWNPASGHAEVHAVRIHRGEQIIDVLASNSFEVLRREDQLELAMLTGMLTAVLRVPDLRVGDDLEIEFSTPLHDPTLREQSHGLLFLSDTPPAGRFRLALQWEDEQEPILRLTDDLKDAAVRSENALTLDFDNPEILTPLKNAPPRYSWRRILEFSDFSDWETISRRFDQMFRTARTLGSDSPLKSEARLIESANDTKLERAQAALELVQQQIRYVYVGLNGGNYIPATADDTWARRYGDCKGKTATLLALLDELGIEAEAVLASNTLSTDGLEDRLPNPALFDHVLVRIFIEDSVYWLDGTLPVVIEAKTQPFLPYKWFLPLSERGEDIARLSRPGPELPDTMGLFEIDASAGFDAPAKRIETTITRGIAGLEDYFRLSSVTAAQLETVYRSQLVGSSRWDSIESVKFRFDRATQASILTITGSGPVDWDERSDGGYVFYLPRGGFVPPARRQREQSVDDEIPFYSPPSHTCYATTVRLPADTPLENWGFNSVYGFTYFGQAYYRMMELRDDHTLRLVRGFRVLAPEISPETAVEDNERLDDFDDSKARLSYNPEGAGEAWGWLQPVTATFETDWTEPYPPCFPEDIIERDRSQ